MTKRTKNKVRKKKKKKKKEKEADPGDRKTPVKTPTGRDVHFHDPTEGL